MADGYVRVPPDSSGKYIDTTEKYNTNNVLVERQRVEIPDEVTVGGEWLTRILVEQRVQNLLLAQGLNVNDNIEGLRDDLSDIAGLTIPDVRELLTEARSYYVSSTGSDSKDGLSAGNAFLTPAHAFAVASVLDTAGYDVTINIADATWTTTFTVLPLFGGGNLHLTGNTTTPSSCVISTTSADAILCGFSSSCVIYIRGFKLVTTTGGACINAYLGALIDWGTMEFGACAAEHIIIQQNSYANAGAAYTISGGALAHIRSYGGGAIDSYDLTVTLSGTPAFTRFAYSDSIAIIGSSGMTYAGTGATGKRYEAILNGVIQTFGSGASYFPGDAAGTTATGGQYA